MATINDTNKLIPYVTRGFPPMGNSERFIANELKSIAQSIAAIIAVMKMMEQRMNTDGLS